MNRKIDRPGLYLTQDGQLVVIYVVSQYLAKGILYPSGTQLLWTTRRGHSFYGCDIVRKVP